MTCVPARCAAAVATLVAAVLVPRPILTARERVLVRARQPLVNQAGYNLGEAKRFTCPGAADGTPFRIVRVPGGTIAFRGVVRDSVGDFSSFEPAASRGEYAVDVDGFERSVSFWIADHLMERLSSRLAYQFLMMYLAEREEPNGQAARFLAYARACAEDIIRSWDFGNPVHTWRARNAEHIAPQALALFLLVAPEQAPPGTREKLIAWRDYIVSRTSNLWQYRTHDDREWAHPKSKEVGTVAGMGGAAFAVAAVLGDPRLRAIGWSQVDFVFGRNPAGAHLGHKSRLRVAMDGFWPGVEIGWPHGYVFGTGELGPVRGTLDGSPTDAAFPFNPAEAASADRPGVYGTEGWSITNRAWMSTVTFSTLGSHAIRFVDRRTGATIQRVKPGDTARVELRAALNHDPTRIETGWIEVRRGSNVTRQLVTETGVGTGYFIADVLVPTDGSKSLTASYGHLAFRKTATASIE